MLVSYELNRAPEALTYNIATRMLDDVAKGGMLGFGMNLMGIEPDEAIKVFQPTLEDNGLSLTPGFTSGFSSGKNRAEVYKKRREIGVTTNYNFLLEWHMDHMPYLDDEPTQTINFHFTPIGFGRLYIGQVRQDRLANFGVDEYEQAREELSRGMVDPDLFNPNFKVASISPARLFIFRSVGHSPAMHRITTNSENRFSYVRYAER